VLDFIPSEEGKYGGWCRFFAKNSSSTFCNNCK
jgi:hypothetical protein